MNKKACIVFSILIALLSMVGSFIPASAGALAAPTPTWMPTRRPALKSVEFNLSTANKIPPADIIKQISLSGAGGGERCKSTHYSTPELVSAHNSNEELMVETSMFSCGWRKNEKLTGTVRYPGGQTRILQVKNIESNGNHGGLLNFRPGIDDPSGNYIFSVSGKSYTVNLTINYTVPKSPAIYILDDYHLLLNKFSPSEKIKLFYYTWSGDGKLIAWQEYATGGDGRLEVNTSMKLNADAIFIAIGEKTGEARMKNQLGLDRRPILLGKKFCSDGLPSRVKVGEQARAAFTDGSNLRIRVQPGFSQSINYKVPEGTKMKIVDGPKCVDGSTWWKMEVSGDIKGWVAEYWNGNEYLIEPIS